MGLDPVGGKGSGPNPGSRVGRGVRGRRLTLPTSSFVWMESMTLALGSGQKAIERPLAQLLTLASTRSLEWAEWPFLGAL